MVDSNPIFGQFQPVLIYFVVNTAIIFGEDMQNIAPWHRADIVSAVRKKGSTLRRLSMESGFAPSTLRASLERLHPRAHEIIARFINASRQEIWPNYYDAKGQKFSRLEQRRRQIIAEKANRKAA